MQTCLVNRLESIIHVTIDCTIEGLIMIIKSKHFPLENVDSCYSDQIVKNV